YILYGNYQEDTTIEVEREVTEAVRNWGICTDDVISSAIVTGTEVSQQECEAVCTETVSCKGYSYSSMGCYPHTVKCEGFTYPDGGGFYYSFALVTEAVRNWGICTDDVISSAIVTGTEVSQQECEAVCTET
ncbi:hypothetical protein CAPTEDRAFT_192613, partial [Capitella teleta]